MRKNNVTLSNKLDKILLKMHLKDLKSPQDKIKNLEKLNQVSKDFI
jgi:hypothetical protein